MKSACFTVIILALFLSSASAHSRHHRTNPMVTGLGLGFAHMVTGKPYQKEWYNGPASMPRYTAAPFDDAHVVGSGWPDTMNIPPKGWPLRRISGDPRPSAWCGWFMRQVKGVTDTAYNLARNWAHYGSSAGGPRVGAIVVWSHHVGEITSGECPAGEWMVHSGNDGHAVRTRCRSVRGAIAFRV